MGLYKRGQVWWMSFTCRGKNYRRSTETEDVKIAKRIFEKVLGEIAQGKLPGVYFDKVCFDELAEAFLNDYRINMKDTLKKAERSVRYLGEAFGRMKVIDITTDEIERYISDRMNQGYSNASINRELAALKRMFHLAAKSTPPKVSMIPYIPMLKESNVRKGFFEHDEYLAIKGALPEDVKPIVTFAYHTGWRKSEILDLIWPKVDVKLGTVRLDPGEAKNEEGRIIYMDDELTREMQILYGKRRLGCPYVFHRKGERIKDFRGAWEMACEKVGVRGRLFHDFRRTAVRNMLRSGIREKVAMMISGHKTRSVFDRYHIVSDDDLKEAARKQLAYLKGQDAMSGDLDQKRGEIIPFPLKEEKG